MTKSLSIASNGTVVYLLNRNPADFHHLSIDGKSAVPGLSMAHIRPHNNEWTFKVCTDGAIV
jgi:hypothetical protein